MSISIRKKYIKFNNERILRAQSKEANYPTEKNYKTNTYINPKFKIKEKNITSNLPYSKETRKNVNYNFRNNTKHIIAITNMNKENSKYNNKTNSHSRVIRRNNSVNIIKRKDLNDINDIISVILEHEVEKLKINLLKYIIDSEDINTILRIFSKIIEDLFNEYNINNNTILNNDANKIIIENKYQRIKDDIMQEYFIINNEVYKKYFSNNKKENLDKLIPVRNFIKHCPRCKDIAMHKSRNELYLIPNTNYIICKETNDIYDKNKFESFCEFDGEIFISSYLTNSYKNKMFILTNRNSLDDEKCVCLRCKHLLYYNYLNKKIKCIKCNTEEIDEYNHIFYNEIFFSKLRDEINFSLVMKRKSNPNKYCSCGGICYKGKFLEKYILVCSKCRKCHYDIRNGRYKYKLYLFQKNKIENELKKIKIHKNRNQSKLIELKITSDTDNTKENNNYNIRRKNNKNIQEINNEKNKIPIMPKVIINFRHFTKNNISNNYNTNSGVINEENKNSKENENSKDLMKIKRELVIKNAKILLLNNSMTENNVKINNFFLSTNPNKTLVSSRKIRALNGYNFDSNKINSGLIKRKQKNNMLNMNSLDEPYNKILDINPDKSITGNKNKEKNEKNIIKKTLTNNNSFSNVKSRNTYFNLNKNILNDFSSTKNLFTNKKRNNETIPNLRKYYLQSDLNMSEYKILSTIYTSSFITIYKAQNISSKKIYAIKKSIFPSKSHLEKWKKQISLLQILNYGHFLVGINLMPIIQYNIKKLDNMSYALYELMPLAEMDLDKKISYSKNILSQNKLIKILKQLINTLYYMQKNGIAHRDIKPGNIFEINDEYYIGDFDQSIKIERNNNNNAIIEEEIKGSEAFMSPIIYEALIKNKKNVRHNIFKSDVYSLGLCFVYALTKNVYVIQKIKSIKQEDKIKMFILGNLYTKNIELKKVFIDIIVKMVIYDEKYRPDFIELYNLIKEYNL